MTITHILVHVEPGASSERRLQYAMSMAAAHNAKLTGLSVMLPPTASAFAMIGDAQIYAAAVEAATESCNLAKTQFGKLTKGSKIAVRWHEGIGIPADVVAAEAGCADIVILGREDSRSSDSGFYALAPADVIMTCRRPVLVVPDMSPEAFRGKRILLGWKSTPEAARAAHDALPLLAKADQVILAEVTPKHPPSRYTISAKAMAEYLGAHGAPVTVRHFPEEGDVGELLIRVAGENDCDLIVAGGYGHNRVREWALGGVTHTLLHNGALPTLVSH